MDSFSSVNCRYGALFFLQVIRQQGTPLQVSDVCHLAAIYSNTQESLATETCTETCTKGGRGGGRGGEGGRKGGLKIIR